MIVSFVYDYEDFSLSKWQFRPSIGAVALIASGALLSIAGAVELTVYVDLLWSLALIVPALFVLAFVGHHRRRWKTPNTAGTPEEWSNCPLSTGTVRVEINPRDYRHDFGDWHMIAEWSAIESIQERAYGIAVVIGPRLYVIPKRAFVSPQQLRDFTTLAFSYFGRPITKLSN